MSNTKIEIIFSGWQTIFLDRSASKAQTSLFGAENRNRSGQRLFQACQTLWILALPPLHKRQPLHRLAGVKLGTIAAASVLAGGLAAAWWYRNTLKKLHQVDERSSNPHFGIPKDDSANG
jgi:hypothetical protein